VGLSGVELLADESVRGMRNVVVGGNRRDVHLVNANAGRDFAAPSFRDLALIRKGDRCARCGAELDSFRGIEVGQIFKLGTKYSSSMKATFLDEDGVAKPLVMGCYGLGVSRTTAAIVEQHHDHDGIAWPSSVAPYAVHLLVINPRDAGPREAADSLYEALRGRGIEVLYDDRDESPGAKFKDADLVGMPLRITVGDRGLKRGVVETRVRKTGEKGEVPRDSAAEAVAEMLPGLP
jgi:prolyl-tRNA synthetase